MPPAKKEYLQQAGILNMKLGLFSLFFFSLSREGRSGCFMANILELGDSRPAVSPLKD